MEGGMKGGKNKENRGDAMSAGLHQDRKRGETGIFGSLMHNPDRSWKTHCNRGRGIDFRIIECFFVERRDPVLSYGPGISTQQTLHTPSFSEKMQGGSVLRLKSTRQILWNYCNDHRMYRISRGKGASILRSVIEDNSVCVKPPIRHQQKLFF